MKIAVTSASGQLGAAIVEQLKKDIGVANVVGIARTPQKAEHLGVEIRKGDYNSRSDFDEALKGMDAVMILSGNAAPEDRIGQHRNIIEAAKSNGLKKIVYTSIIGAEVGNAFSPIVQSNRQTEEDVRNSGLAWVIGRNGIYIEPDLEYIDHYVKAGEIANCAGDGRCGYTSRAELAVAYSHMLQEDQHNGKTFNLMGEAISQSQLADFVNQVFDTHISFRAMTEDDYMAERKAQLGDFLGTVIAGIYVGISQGAYDITSDFETAAGRPHKSVLEMMQTAKKAQG